MEAERFEPNRVLEAAAEGRVDAIVSGDQHLLALVSWRDIVIHSPSAFLADFGGEAAR
jgi:predicted nucleic acid-binding protein